MKEITYKNRIEELKKEEEIHKQKNNFYVALRLICFIGGLVFIFSFYRLQSYRIIAFITIIIGLIFLYLTQKHSIIRLKLERIKKNIELNEVSIKRYNHNIKELDNGSDLIENNHSYMEDLDILGENSLFQWICSAVTPSGRVRLKDTLSGKSHGSKEEILQRQIAIEELSGKYSFYEGFLVEALVGKEKFKDPKSLIQWSNGVVNKFAKKTWYLIANISTFLLILSVIIPFIFPSFSFNLSKIIIAVNIGLILFDIKDRNENLQKIFIYKKDIERYGNILSYFEESTFDSSYLNSLKEEVFHGDGSSITKRIREFSNIANNVADRGNIFYWVLNILFLWDYRINYKLERFKVANGKSIEEMINVIAEVESLLSLSNVNRDNRDWAIPKIEDQSLIVEGIQLAHPLIFNNAISNDISLKKNRKIYLITGSNMAGKSTMLRTVGINLVLAYVGTKVKAEKFNCSLMNIFTLMRTSDNLEESISSFYAEILRVKQLITLSKESKPVFFLIDEIFKGTNSMDRHIGAKMLINQLSNNSVLGIVSTHDLELGAISESNQYIENHHFREYYKDDKLLFDYKLRDGVSTTRNALYLMKMAGIDVDM